MTNEIIHPFELSGMGRAPFRCVGAVSLPSKSLAETNPGAYQAALRDLPWGYRLGSCHHCGMPIVNNYLIESSDGVKSSVGCDCVEKTNDKALTDEVKKEAARIEREKRAAKREANQALALANWREKNPEMAKAADEQRKAHAEAREAREEQARIERERVKEVWAFVAKMLDFQSGEFCASVARDIRDGYAPRGRAVSIVADIYAKGHGRRGSKAYDAALTEFYTKTGEQLA